MLKLRCYRTAPAFAAAIGTLAPGATGPAAAGADAGAGSVVTGPKWHHTVVSP